MCLNTELLKSPEQSPGVIFYPDFTFRVRQGVRGSVLAAVGCGEYYPGRLSRPPAMDALTAAATVAPMESPRPSFCANKVGTQLCSFAQRGALGLSAASLADPSYRAPKRLQFPAVDQTALACFSTGFIGLLQPSL